MMELNVICLFKKKRFQLRFKKINIKTSSNFKGELVPQSGGSNGKRSLAIRDNQITKLKHINIMQSQANKTLLT